ncbi:hypothetical protein F6455_14555 [Proteobacteria bacterium 005FR1]|nr:hypothetical protein [Proteobacteria bacterium 005FR1]
MKKILVTITAVFSLSNMAHAEHSWGDYHWARTTPSFDLIIVNSTTSDWDAYVTQAVADWSLSSVMNMVEEAGATDKQIRRRCAGGEGSLRICNLEYGRTGWLGVAGISIDANGHIFTGYTKMNDTYFSEGFYNTPAWRQSVTCQELGHNVGLDHQDEDFNNGTLLSCMDYQDPPYPYPNQHDYDQLEAIYEHLDSYDSYSQSTADTGDEGCNAPPGKGCNRVGANGDIGWGISLGRRGNVETFLRIDANGIRHVTRVIWAEQR